MDTTPTEAPTPERLLEMATHLTIPIRSGQAEVGVVSVMESPTGLWRVTVHRGPLAYRRVFTDLREALLARRGNVTAGAEDDLALTVPTRSEALETAARVYESILSLASLYANTAIANGAAADHILGETPR